MRGLSVFGECTVNPVWGAKSPATVVGDGDNAKIEANDRAADIEQTLLPNLSGAEGVTRSDYDSDGYAGSKFSLSSTPMEAINSDSENGSLTLSRDGDTFVFDGVVNFSPESDEAPPDRCAYWRAEGCAGAGHHTRY